MQIRFARTFRETLHNTIERLTRDGGPSDRTVIQNAVDKLTRLGTSGGLRIVEVGEPNAPDERMRKLAWNVRVHPEVNQAFAAVVGIRLSKGVDSTAESDIVEGLNAAIGRAVSKGRRVFVVVPWQEEEQPHAS